MSTATLTRQLAPCGTPASRRRHKRNGETCQVCDETNRLTNLAPCGTYAARKRHLRKGEECDTCVSRIELAHCPSDMARRRHKRNGEDCRTCYTRKTAYPCGTHQARRRHRRAGETCETCTNAMIEAGTHKLISRRAEPQPCGTDAAIKRHRYHGEPVCDTCKAGDRQRAAERRRAKGIKEHMTAAEIIAEIEWLHQCGEGWHRIAQATGYTERTLETKLYNSGRADLYRAIFNTPTGWVGN